MDYRNRNCCNNVMGIQDTFCCRPVKPIMEKPCREMKPIMEHPCREMKPIMEHPCREMKPIMDYCGHENRCGGDDLVRGMPDRGMPDTFPRF